MHSDWDVINEIFLTAKRLGFELPLWVKGHQDDKCPRMSLPMPARANCYADDLATEHNQYLHRVTQHLPNFPLETVPRLPNNRAQLHLHEDNRVMTVTRGYATALREHATTQALLAYICHRFDWHPDTLEEIHWPAFSAFIQRHKQHQTILIKMLHKLSPTNRRVHRYDPLRPPTCPYCDEIETEDHSMLQCSSTCTRKWRNDTLKKIPQTSQRLDTHLDLQDVLLEGLHSWLSGKPLNPRKFPSYLRPLIESQCDIGWDQIFRGRFSYHWALLQEAYYLRKDSESDLSGEKWTTTMASTAFKCWLDMWTARNTLVHGKDDEAKTKLERDRAIAKLRMLYSAQATVRARFHNIFRPLALLAQAPTKSITNWISLHGAMIRKYVQAHARQRGLATRAIWDYFLQHPDTHSCDSSEASTVIASNGSGSNTTDHSAPSPDDERQACDLSLQFLTDSDPDTIDYTKPQFQDSATDSNISGDDEDDVEWLRDAPSPPSIGSPPTEIQFLTDNDNDDECPSG